MDVIVLMCFISKFIFIWLNICVYMENFRSCFKGLCIYVFEFRGMEKVLFFLSVFREFLYFVFFIRVYVFVVFLDSVEE